MKTKFVVIAAMLAIGGLWSCNSSKISLTPEVQTETLSETAARSEYPSVDDFRNSGTGTVIAVPENYTLHMPAGYSYAAAYLFIPNEGTDVWELYEFENETDRHNAGGGVCDMFLTKAQTPLGTVYTCGGDGKTCHSWKDSQGATHMVVCQ